MSERETKQSTPAPEPEEGTAEMIRRTVPGADLVWDDKQLNHIRRICVPSGAAPDARSFATFIGICMAARLNPLLKEIYLVPRRSKNCVGHRKYGCERDACWVTTYQAMVARDGYRVAAHRTGELRGVAVEVFPPIPDDADTDTIASLRTPTHARATVYRKGWEVPRVVTVLYGDYVQTDKHGNPTDFWKNKARTMLEKVAEAQAIRGAFDLHGTYHEAEIQADEPEQPRIVQTTGTTRDRTLAALKARAGATPVPDPEPPATCGKDIEREGQPTVRCGKPPHDKGRCVENPPTKVIDAEPEAPTGPPCELCPEVHDNPVRDDGKGGLTGRCPNEGQS